MPAQPSPGSPVPAVTTEYGLPGQMPEAFLTQFIAAVRDDPFGTWLLVPTQRIARQVTGRLAEKGIPFLPSRICTTGGFCRTLFEEHRTTERFIPDREAKLLLEEILAKNVTKYPLFITREHPAPGTINDLMKFMNVIEMRKVAFPECLLDLQGEKSDQLNAILTTYHNRLKDLDSGLDLVDSNTILKWTTDFLHRSGTSPLRSVFVFGFHDSLPLEEDLFDAIREHAGAVHFLIPDGSDPALFRGRPPGQALPGTWPSPDPSSLPWQITGLFAGKEAFVSSEFFRVQTFPTPAAELAAIAAEIGRLNGEGVPLSGIAVVFPDVRGDLGLITEVFADAGIPWNAAVGPRLSRAPVVRFLLGILRLAASGPERGEMVRLAASPFFRHGAVPGGTSRLDASELDLVSRYAGIDGPRPDWKGRLDRLVLQLEDPEKAKHFPGISRHTVERVREGVLSLTADLDSLGYKRTARDHIAAFRTFLGRWEIPCLAGAPDEDLKAREIRSLQQFLSRLDGLARAPFLPADTMLSIQEFSRLAAALAEEPDDAARQDEPGVSVLGLRECPHLRFSIVFIGGLSEGVFPRLTTRLPFTNALENARMGTRSLAEVLKEEQYFFIAALLAAERHVYLSAPLSDGTKTLLTSAFFERVHNRAGACPWPAAPAEARSGRAAATGAGKRINEGEPCSAVPLVAASQDINDLAGRITMEQYHRQGSCDSPYDGILAGDCGIAAALLQRYGPDHVWSATTIETYAACPFSYFLGRVLGLAALPEIELNLSASDRGTAIHDILSAFFREWRASGHTNISLSSLADATEMMLRIASAELSTWSYESPLWDATRARMLGSPQGGPGYLQKFLDCEAEEESSPLVPSRFELSFGMPAGASDDPASSPDPVELASSDGMQKLRIRGRIDRIDIAPDKRFIIYDYKSGRGHPKAADIDAGTALQLPLYLLAYQAITGSQGIGGGYYTIRRDVERSIILADAGLMDLYVSRIKPSQDFVGILQRSLASACADIEGIRAGRFPLPAAEECPNPKYCDFRRICRFDPYRAERAGEGT